MKFIIYFLFFFLIIVNQYANSNNFIQYQYPFDVVDRRNIKFLNIIDIYDKLKIRGKKGEREKGVYLYPEIPIDGVLSVYPVISGVVLKVVDEPFNRYIIIKHNDSILKKDIYIVYKNLSSIYVKFGDKVYFDKKIGSIDGLKRKKLRKIDRYLYLEIKSDQKYYSPIKFLKKRIKREEKKIIIISPRKIKNMKKVKKLVKRVKKVCKCKVLVFHHKEIDIKKIKKISPIAIIIGGQNTPWSLYSESEIDNLKQIIKNCNTPTLGICGGHQLIVLSYGGIVAPIFSKKKYKKSYKQCKRMKGKVKTKILTWDKILDGLKKEPFFYSYHCEEAKTIDKSFDILISNDKSPIYMIKHKKRDLYGVQFHPEYYKNGEILLYNFLKEAFKIWYTSEPN